VDAQPGREQMVLDLGVNSPHNQRGVMAGCGTREFDQVRQLRADRAIDDRLL
jgi:hypothetical protein